MRASAALLLLLPACGPGVPSSPREAVRALLGAVESGDVGALHACTAGTPEEYRALDAWVRSERALGAFRDAFVSEYGARAWEQFNDEAGAHFPGGMPDDAQAGGLEFAVDGDRATCTLPGRSGSLLLRRAWGGWRVAIPSLLPLGEDPRRAEIALLALADLLDRERARIGEPGVTPTTLDVDVGFGLARIRRAAAAAVLDDAPGR